MGGMTKNDNFLIVTTELRILDFQRFHRPVARLASRNCNTGWIQLFITEGFTITDHRQDHVLKKKNIFCSTEKLLVYRL